MHTVVIGNPRDLKKKELSHLSDEWCPLNNHLNYFYISKKKKTNEKKQTKKKTHASIFQENNRMSLFIFSPAYFPLRHHIMK